MMCWIVKDFGGFLYGLGKIFQAAFNVEGSLKKGRVFSDYNGFAINNQSSTMLVNFGGSLHWYRLLQAHHNILTKKISVALRYTNP